MRCSAAGGVTPFGAWADPGYVSLEHAVYTFDIRQERWQERCAQGDLPQPALTIGLAVANGCAYLLANPPDWRMDFNSRLEVFELNLESWHSRKLPCKGEAAAATIRPKSYLLFSG